MHQNCKHCTMSKINHNVSDLKYTKFENVLPQFGHINANKTSAIEFFYHLKKTKTKKTSISMFSTFYVLTRRNLCPNLMF